MATKKIQVKQKHAAHKKLQKCVRSNPIATFLIVTEIYTYYINNINNGPMLVDFSELIKDENQRLILDCVNIRKILAVVANILLAVGIKFKVVPGEGYKLMLFLYIKDPVKDMKRLQQDFNTYDRGLSDYNPIIGNKLLEAKFRTYKAGKSNRNPFTDILESWKKQNRCRYIEKLSREIP